MSQRKLFDNLFDTDRLNRRDFMQGAAALGISTTAATSMWSKKAKASPKKGGHLRAGLAGASTSDVLDPGQTLDTPVNAFCRGIRNNLIEVDYKNNVQGELAESWEATPDARIWTFKIRSGIEFHNGKTFTVEDAMYTINAHRAEGSKSAIKSLLDAVVEIKKTGNDTFQVELENGNADFPYILSDYHMNVIPDGTTDYSDGMGTGAYILEQFDPGVRYSAKKNPNYWKEGRGHFDSVEIIGISDVNARTNALKSGELDTISRCDVKTLKLLARVSGLQIIQGDGFKFYNLPMLQNINPYDKVDATLALKYAINREEVLEKVLRGYGSVGNDHPISKNSKYLNTDLPQRLYDPDKAAYHAKKAGVQDHVFNLSAADAAFEGAVDLAVLYKEHAAKAGININVVREPNDGYWSNIWQKKEWCTSYWSGRPTQDWMWSLAYAKGAAWSDTGWDQSDRFNDLLVQARAELDEGLRGEMYGEMQVIAHNECPAVAPMFAADLAAANDKCMFENYAANEEMDGARFLERWWFA